VSYKVRIPRRISKAIGGCGLSRTLLIHLFTLLHQRLTHDADFFRNHRYSLDPECFLMPVLLSEADAWLVFTFRIDDRSEAGVMLVVDFSFERRAKT
jgi:hypothetical protein